MCACKRNAAVTSLGPQRPAYMNNFVVCSRMRLLQYCTSLPSYQVRGAHSAEQACTLLIATPPRSLLARAVGGVPFSD